MTVLALIAVALALAMLAAGLMLLIRLRRQLSRIEIAIAEQPVGLSAEDAASVAELAAQRTAASLRRATLLPALDVDDGDGECTPRLSGPRIKAAGWAAGAGETMRRLRQGA